MLARDRRCLGKCFSPLRLQSLVLFVSDPTTGATVCVRGSPLSSEVLLPRCGMWRSGCAAGTARSAETFIQQFWPLALRHVLGMGRGGGISLLLRGMCFWRDANSAFESAIRVVHGRGEYEDTCLLQDVEATVHRLCCFCIACETRLNQHTAAAAWQVAASTNNTRVSRELHYLALSCCTVLATNRCPTGAALKHRASKPQRAPTGVHTSQSQLIEQGCTCPPVRSTCDHTQAETTCT